MLLEMCREQQPIITNTIFQQKGPLKTTWMHPQSEHWDLIDYVLVRQRDLKDVLHTRVMSSTECHTDHRLVRCKLRLHFKRKPRKGHPPPQKTFNSASCEVKADSLTGLLTKLQNDSCPEDPSPKTLWINRKLSSCRHLKKFWGLPRKRTKTSSMRTTMKFKNGWQRDQPTKLTWLSCLAL